MAVVTLEINVKVQLSVWDAIKIRIAGPAASGALMEVAERLAARDAG